MSLLIIPHEGRLQLTSNVSDRFNHRVERTHYLSDSIKYLDLLRKKVLDTLFPSWWFLSIRSR